MNFNTILELAMNDLLELAQARVVAMGGLSRREGTGRFITSRGPERTQIEVTRLAVGSGGAHCVASWDRADLLARPDHRAPCVPSAGRHDCMPHPSTLPPSAYVFRGGGQCDTEEHLDGWCWRAWAYEAAARTLCSLSTPNTKEIP